MIQTYPNDLGAPNSFQEITPEWLSRLLSQRFEGTVVERVDFGRVIHGTATKIRLLLEYNERGRGHALPPTLWLKVGLEAHREQQAEVYRGETRFYSDLAAKLDIGCPNAFAAWIAPDSGQAMLLLEDLLARHVRFTDATTPLNLEQASRVIKLLARLHGRTGQADFSVAHPWLKQGGALSESGVIESFFEDPIWNSSMNLPRARFASGDLLDRSGLHTAMLNLLERDRRLAHCVVHGDSHIGNLCFDRNDQPAYIDWQTVMLGHWAHDVGNFIPLALTIEDRRHGERDLLALYLAELGQYEVPVPDFSSAWLEYRTHALYTFNFVLCPVELQTEEVCTASAERACAAINQLGSLEACGLLAM